MEAVEAFPPPSTVKKLQQFLGLVNFYWCFLPRLAATLKLLTDALQGAKMGADAVQWSSDREEAFLAAKKALAAATRSAHHCQSSELSLAVDASATHVGACLKQRLPRTTVRQPLGFYWKKLDKAQVKYSAFDRELLACYLAIRIFVICWRGDSSWCTLTTNHSLSYVAEFTSDIRHIKGVNNVVAEALSWPPASPPVLQVAAVSSPPALPFTAE